MVSRKFLHCSVLRVRLQSGEYSEDVTPVPISNTEVKLLRANGTWWAAAWESRSLPVKKIHAYGRVFFLLYHKGPAGTGSAGLFGSERVFLFLYIVKLGGIRNEDFY